MRRIEEIEADLYVRLKIAFYYFVFCFSVILTIFIALTR